jgi:hypothetical protein
LWGLFAGFLFVAVVTPAIHYMRAPQFKTANISEKVDMISKVVPTLLDPETHADIAEKVNTIANPLFRYFNNDILIDRLEMIQDMDLVVSQAKRRGYLGWPLLLEDLKKILPSFLVEKSVYGDVDVISFYYGIRPYGLAGFPTMGLFATAFATFGWLGGCILTYLLVLIYFLVIKIIAGPFLYKNIWAIFLMALLWVAFSERSVEQLVVSIFRETPVLVIMMLLVIFLLKESSVHDKKPNPLIYIKGK